MSMTAIYTMQYQKMLEAVTEKRSYMNVVFGAVDITDGVTHSDTAYRVKTIDMEPVVNTYSKDPNVGFGTGTSNSSRFGPVQEIIAKDIAVPYTYDYAINEGIDKFTVNADADAVVAQRLLVHAGKQLKKIDTSFAHALMDASTKNITSTTVKEIFDDLNVHFKNNEVIGQRVLFVTPEFNNEIVMDSVNTTAKNSTVNINLNEAKTYRGFMIVEVPSQLLERDGTQYNCIATVVGIGKAFFGMDVTRIVEAIDFNGSHLQSAGRGGSFIPDANKVAIAVSSVTITTPINATKPKMDKK